MKQIKIQRITLENFKRHRLLVLDLQGRNTTVAGDNATGKSSIYDGFCWLLFGRDSLGNGEKNMDIKPLAADGNVADHQAITSVEAVLSVDGEELTLKRTYREVWSTKRGALEPSFDGNTSEYYIDGVPVQKKGFADKVGELVDEDTFRALTDVKYFAQALPWQERRRVLFDIAGVMDDRQILATDERFALLVESMGKLSLEDYKKKLLAEKRQLVGAKTDIPARISECQKAVDDIAGLDFEAAKVSVEKLTAKKDELNSQLLSVVNSNAAEQKGIEIRRVEVELDALEKENRLHRQAQTTGGADVHSLKSRLTYLDINMGSKQRQIRKETDYIADLDGKITGYRNRWMAVSGETFTDNNCPVCGQTLPEERLRASMEQFEEDKRKRLTQIEEAASSFKSAKAAAEDRLATAGGELKQMEAEQESINKQIQAAEAAKVEPKDMEGYAERKKAFFAELERLNDQLHEIIESTAGVKSRLRREISELTQQIAEHQAVVNKESLLVYTRERIEQLQAEAQNAAQCLGAIEQMLWLMDEYNRYKTRFVEESVNGQFRLAKFRLFREQANGGIEERCDAQYDGVPYGSVNNGMKINLGVDIINTLSRHYGVSVPLFVDNAESVTRLEQSDAQVIRLEVSKNDKELNVNYENS